MRFSFLKITSGALISTKRFKRLFLIITLRYNNFFNWIKGAELIELGECNTSEDPVRPELDNEFRSSYGRKIFGVKYQDEIHAVMCFAYTNEIPKTVEELDKFSHDAFLQSTMRDQNVVQILPSFLPTKALSWAEQLMYVTGIIFAFVAELMKFQAFSIWSPSAISAMEHPARRSGKIIF